MSLLQGALAMGRSQAEARMTETVLIYEETVGDPESGSLDPTVTRVQHYGDDGGPARIKYDSQVVSAIEPAGQLVSAQQVVLSIPAGSGSAVMPDDTVEVTASTADEGLVGRKYTVKGRPQAGQVTAQRLIVEEVS